MEKNLEKPNPWLIAAWPGMGNVALIAAGFLVHQLKMKKTTELSAEGYFEIGEAEITDGIVTAAKLPQGLFYRWNNPRGRDLIVFMSEAQPALGAYAYANELLEMATKMGAEKVVTFASIASGLHPAESPKVMGLATDADTLAELRGVEVEPLNDGRISGLNGVVLAAAAERGLPGLCLLAEIPFFAMGVPNPKAARAALSVFSVLAGIDVSLKKLNKQAAVIDKALIDAVERYRHERAEGRNNERNNERNRDRSEPMDGSDRGEGPGERPEPEFEAEASADVGAEAGEEVTQQKNPVLDLAARRRLERLFGEAREDTAKARPLKEELDRLGVFAAYEDLFLDLFRRRAA